MSNSDGDDFNAKALELVTEAADQLNRWQEERTCELVRASTEYVGSGTPYGRSSQSELKSLVEAVERDLRQNRDTRNSTRNGSKESKGERTSV